MKSTSMVDPVLEEVWAVKDAATKQLKTVANYAAYLREKYSPPAKTKPMLPRLRNAARKKAQLV